MKRLISGVWKRFCKLPGLLRILIEGILLIFVAFLIIDLILPFRPAITYSQVVLDKKGNVVHAFLTPDQKWRMKCSLSEVNPLLVKAIVWKEDKWFWYHPGCNPVALIRAAWQNTVEGERVSGASTITMQVVRLLEHRKRNLLNKFIEIFKALQLEFHYSKSEILEMYLNLLPYGGNIEGIRSASLLYFKQSPETLSPAQVATLVIVPNNPHHLRLGQNNDRIRRERNRWLIRWAGEGFVPQDQLAMSVAEPLSVKRLNGPAGLPHLANTLRLMYPDENELRTFIDPAIQDEVTRILESEVQHLRMSGITNGAVVVINNHTHGIEAYLGSAGFSDNRYLGQVNGCEALRSPGSALKPFLYALALDQGLITPRTLLSDIPINFNGYRPQNYDETFRGQLPASQALALSLNVPAVELTNEMGVDVFVGKLSRGGLKWMEKNKNSLGLSVVLGGCGVTLTELTSLYSSLATRGLHYPVRYTNAGKEDRPDTLFSTAASWMVTEMLTNLKRPDLPGYFENSIHLPHIAWKTGTSYGRRDAWSIGYNPDYTVGVWVGNFDGSGVPELSGSESAVPVLFRIFTSLSLHQQPSWFGQPADVDYRLVCSESGLPPNDFCENVVMDYYIPSVSGNRKCNHLAEVFTNLSGTMSYCRNCLPEAGYTSRYYPNLSPALISYYNDQQIPYLRIPPHNPDCVKVSKSTAPRITTLTAGKEYLLMNGSGQQLQLACDAAPDVAKVYWYINDRYFRTASGTEKLFFSPEAGQVKISCCDDKGRNTDIFIRVKFI